MAVTFIKWADDGSLLSKTIQSEYSVKVYPLVCDRLSVTCDMPESLRSYIVKKFKQEKAKPAAGYRYSGLIKELGMKLSPYLPQEEADDKITSATIQCDPFTPGTAFVRLDYNPAKVDYYGLKGLVDQNWLVGPQYGLDYLLAHGKVTRVDFAVDIASEEVNEFLFSYPKIQQVEVIRSKSGRTEYLGAKSKTGKRIIIYDRLPAIKGQNAKKFYAPQQQIPEPDQPIMRIEMRLYPQDTAFKDLSVLKNPFESLTVAAFKPKQDDDPMWNLFLALARFEGAQATLGRLTKHKRTEYTAKLKKGTVGWWKPAHIWDQLPAVLSSITGK